MESPDKKGFYTFASSSAETTHKPMHLEKRFNSHTKRNLKNLSKETVEIKREAILEERRRKLHQNFQKVKRIAKEMKARREDKIDLLSKSMALAEMNRNQHIEKRRAASKQTVERAKYIVLQNRYRSQQEQERRRAELESRFEKTEQRRLAHLNRYQQQKKKKLALTPSSPTCLITPMSNISIQTKLDDQPKLKKPSNWSIILKAFRELGLPLPSNPDTWLEFNVLSQLLNQPKVIVVTTKVLNTALKLNNEESRHRARVLLTSYMTLMCPKEVLQNVNGTEEKRLHVSAKQMLNLFEIWLKAHGRPGATAARLAFVQAWDEYTILFESWKSRDRNQLIQNMIGYFVELSTLRQTMIAQDNDDSVGDQLQSQLNEIKTKLQKLGGPEALALLQRALEMSASSTSTGRKKQHQINTPRTPNLDNAYETEADANHQRASGDQLSQLLNGYAPESGLTNEQLAHELIMDPEFKLQRQAPTNDLEQRVRIMAEKAFFDKVAQDIDEGNPELSLPSLIMDVKNRLLSLVRPGTSMHQHIDERIDLDLIQQQMRQRTFDLKSMMEYVLGVMADMCAPVRDVEIQVLRQDNNLMQQMPTVLHLLEDMSLDLANFRLRSLRPHLMPIAVEYEREKFASMLNTGQIQLVRTQSWLTQSASKLCQAAAERNPERVRPEKNNKPTHDSVFEEAYVSLLVQSLPVSVQTLPETLFMDAKRLHQFQNDVQAVTIVAALLMLARNFGSASPQALSDLGSKLFTMLEDPATAIDHLAAEIESAVNVRPERREMIRTMVDKTVSHSDTVYSLLSRRVASVIKLSIQNNTFVTDAVLASNGLQHVRSHLQAIAHKILRMTHHHRKVFASYYDEIIKTALHEHLVVSPTTSQN
ncbi:T-complex protein 11-domain-containing protein [Thamnidium elegans]|uniref:T-complex protein 11-like protein 1 n=1 Tax=Thamnidium elegans TaxID=101142 RepID=A0A8H7SUX5_9FUNG|nr:hypothetical protein INT48_003406 [Thamnidium elegans]KAI8059713.1 T-complex protein 11-domain-containing protein [Thamnidium elegans]